MSGRPHFPPPELTVSPKSQQQAIAAIAKASEKMAQDNVHISEIIQKLPEGEQYGQENKDGSINEPNIDISFEQPLSEDDVKLLEEITQGEAELAGFTINPDRKGINLYNISKFEDHEQFLTKAAKLEKILQSRGIRSTVTRNIRRLLNIGNKEYGATRTYEDVRGQNVQSQESVSGTPEGKVTTPPDVHAAAKEAGVDYESPEFIEASKTITGKEHLDDMTPPELDQMVDYINKTEPPPPSPPKTDSVALEPEEKKLSGIKKALVPESKVESTPIERRSMEEMLASAKEQVDSGAINPKAIVDEIALGNARALQADEVAALVYYKTKLDG